MDILYEKKREKKKGTSKSEDIVKIEEEKRKVYQKWSQADYILYHHANKTFWEQYSKHKDIQEETNHFREVKDKVQNYCQENLYKYLHLVNDSPKLFYRKLLNTEETFTIESSKWNSAFKVDHLFCLLLRFNDNAYRFTMK